MSAAVPSEYRTNVEPFGDGYMITLMSPDLRVSLLTHGATISSVQYRVPHLAGSGIADKDGWVHVALGFDTPAEFMQDTSYMGRTVGRYAGRIANGEVAIAGKTFALLRNDGDNTLHGGPDGFSMRPWKYIRLDGADEMGIAFHLISPHLDQGFPGELHVTATYTILKSKPATLKWNLQAVVAESSPVDATTVNLCNHMYWNLNGVPSVPRRLPPPVTNHELQLHASYVAEMDELIPTGSMMAVEGTPHDYRTCRPIRDGIEATRAMGRDPPGYDDPIALDKWDSELHAAGRLVSPATGITMRLETTSPAVIVYTANHLPEKASGEAGERFQRHSGICLETQFFPNSPHIPSFPSTVIKKGQKYDETTVCHLSIAPQK